MAERSDTAIQGDVDVISLAIQGCDDHRRALAAQRALNRLIEEIERLRAAISTAESEARRYAEFYPAHSDGRNTFLILADRIAELAEVKNG
jgi:hypothetical protein